MKKSVKQEAKKVVAGKIEKLCRRALQPDPFFDYINREFSEELQEMCILDDSGYADLLEEQFRSHGRNARVNARLNTIEARLKSGIRKELDRLQIQ